MVLMMNNAIVFACGRGGTGAQDGLNIEDVYALAKQRLYCKDP